ncbi:MAG TPA: hypothetical protein EYH06_03240 [Chromatiales bacterium]|nr:hypothetical protein [Thiotrichales bacterium]HIP67585.1 hypothetical protein [Chromatiales bacterium]
MKIFNTKNITYINLCVLLITSLWLPVLQADMIDIQTAVEHELALTQIDRVQTALNQQNVQEQLEMLGVDPVSAQERIAALTSEEIALLDQRLQEMPAGAGALEVIGIVFLVLLILELVGVINIFQKI